MGVGFRVAVSALGTGCQSLLDVNLVSLRVNVPWVGQCVIGGWDKGGCAFDDGVRWVGCFGTIVGLGFAPWIVFSRCVPVVGNGLLFHVQHGHFATTIFGRSKVVA